MTSCFSVFGVLFAVLILHVQLSSSATVKVRQPRSISQFGRMIRFATRMEALLFNDYGNHCGSNNINDVAAVDNIDACCRDHDLCYDRANAESCDSSLLGPYYIFYRWSTPSDSYISCDDSSGCKQAVCNCDKAAALCMGHYSTEYNRSHKRSNFWDWLI